jgi:hypothetical protein
MIVVGDPVAVGVDDEVAGAVVRDLEQLVGHGIQTQLPGERVTRRKAIDVFPRPTPHRALWWKAIVAANTFERFTFC